jgi:hypothetical protein
VGEEGVTQSFRGCESLVGIESQTALEEIDKVIELPGLRVIQATGCGQQAGTQVTRRLDGCQGSDGGLQREASQLSIRFCRRYIWKSRRARDCPEYAGPGRGTRTECTSKRGVRGACAGMGSHSGARRAAHRLLRPLFRPAYPHANRGIMVVGSMASRGWIRGMCEEAHMAVPRAFAGKGVSRASLVGRGIPAASSQRLPVP